MKIFKEIFMSKEEKAIRQKRRKVSNKENPPIATDVELIVDHSVWHKGKEKKTFGQGPLRLVIDGERMPEGPWNEAVPEGYRKSGLSVFRIGKGMNFLVPCYMGMHFMRQGKYSHTFLGKKRMGKIMLALLILSYLFLIYYLPRSDSINEHEMITGHYAQLIYLAAFLIGFFGWWYGKKTTANRVKLQCFDPQQCDLHDIHVGIFTCAKYTPEQQIAWWTNKTIPQESINQLNKDLMKQNRSYQQEIVKLMEDVDVYRLLGDMKAIMKLKREGFLLKDDGMVLFYRRATFVLSILFAFFLLYWYAGVM